MTDEELQRIFQGAGTAIRESREKMVAAHNDLNGVLEHVTNARARGKINGQVWAIERALGARDHYFSQSGQDRFLDERVFHGKRDGIFVEVGGYDGVTGSNCLFFEMMRGWTGLLVEPSPTQFARAQDVRRATCLRAAVADQAGEAEFLDIQEGYTQMSGLTATYAEGLRTQVEADPRHKGALITVPVTTLPDILDDNGLTEIDYVSLDVEGGELAILSGFPFDRYRITAWTIENNQADVRIPELMIANGYRRIEALGVDDVYVRTG